MKILITSGGTTEKIDTVRGITNHATGRLGLELTQLFLKDGHHVTLVTTPTALRPQPQENLVILDIQTVDQLLHTLEPLVKESDVLIHSMAVSDYTPVYMTSLEEVEETSPVAQLIKKKNSETKISSQAEYQVLFLKKTPKVISFVKQWNPNIRLVGFKLLVGVDKQELISVARKSLENNQADYILANDLTEITKNQHRAYLVSKDQVFPAQTKQEIARLILEKVTE